MDHNAKPTTPKSENTDWRAEFTPHLRHQYLQKILDSLNKELASSSEPNSSHRMIKISQHLEQKAFRDATSKDDYVYSVNGRIMNSIQKLRNRILAGSSSNSDVTQTSIVAGADQNSRLQNVHQVSRDIAGSPVSQGMQSDVSASSRREIPGIQSSQKVVYEQNQQQELQHQRLKHKVQQSSPCPDILNNQHHQQQQHIVSQPSQLGYSQSLKALPESQNSQSPEQVNTTIYHLNQFLVQENTVEEQQLSSCRKNMPNSKHQQPAVSLQSNVSDLQQPSRMFTTQSKDKNIQSHPHSGPSLRRVGDISSKQKVRQTGLPVPIHQLPVSQNQSKQAALELLSVPSQPQNVLNQRKQQPSQGTNAEASSDVTQTSMVVGADQNSRLQNVRQVSRDVAGSPVSQEMQSDMSASSCREVPGIQSSQKVLCQKNQRQELRHQRLKHKVQQSSPHHDNLNNQHHQQQHIVSQPCQLRYSQSLKALPDSQNSESPEQVNTTICHLNQLLVQENTVEEQQLSSCRKNMAHSKKQPVGLQSNVSDLQQPLRMFTTQSNDKNILSSLHSGPRLRRVGDISSKQKVQQTGLPLLIHQLPVSQNQSKQAATHQRLELLSVPSQPQNVLNKQKQPLTQGTSAEASSESKAPSEQANIAEVHDPQAYQKLQSLKELYLPQLKDFYIMLDIMRQKTPDPEMAEKHSKKLIALKKLIKFLFIRQDEMVQLAKGMFEYYQGKILEAVRCFQLIRSNSVRQHAPICQPPDGQSQVPQLQQLGNRNLQFSSAPSTSTSTPGDSFPASSMQQGIPSFQPQHHLQMTVPVAPRISQHSSAQADQRASVSSLSIGGEPLRSPGSTLTTASTSTPLIPFTTPADYEMLTSSAPPLSIPHNLGHTRTSVASAKVDTPTGILNQPVAATSSGISASCLPITSTNPDGNQQSASTRDPFKRLLDAVQSLSAKSLRASVSEMGSVVNLFETLAGTASNHSRAAVGEDLTYEARRSNLEGGKFWLQNGCFFAKNENPMAVTVSSSSLCETNDPDQSAGEMIWDLSDSPAASRFKRHRIEPINALLDEMRHINQQMVETVVDLDSTQETATLDAAEGTTVICTYHAVAFNESFRMQYASEMLPVLSLRLLVGADYPNSSPKVLDALNFDLSDNEESAANLVTKTRLRFDRSIRQLSEPMSLGEMVKCWDASASEVYREFARQVGGECFSSKYGTWENCVTA